MRRQEGEERRRTGCSSRQRARRGFAPGRGRDEEDEDYEVGVFKDGGGDFA
jgi:hypothetical protein